MNLQNAFSQPNLFYATIDFLKQLNIPLDTPMTQALTAKGILKEYAKDTELYKKMTEIFFIGIITDRIFSTHKKEHSVETSEVYKVYDGLAIFAIEMNSRINRSEIAELTHAFNNMAQDVPVALIFRYRHEGQTYISIATNERFMYRETWYKREKISKVTIIRDINIAKPSIGHLNILDNLSQHNASNYNDLHNKMLGLFDTKRLAREFYHDISDWYKRAKRDVKFPSEHHGEHDTNLIRLLSRIVFIWFMKELKMVPNKFFEEEFIVTILKNFDPADRESGNYYNAILQNLFFATLNQKIKGRKFTEEEGPHVARDLYRYKELFKIEQSDVLKLFKLVPFLNGGLFDCLDKEDKHNKMVYIDGFSHNKNHRAFVSNSIFFGKHGLYEILNKYTFTVIENTPFEEDVTLDPGILGGVFENLLAEHNPETKEIAHKFNGSFYTPREIIQYMVDESLIEYLKRIFVDSGNYSINSSYSIVNNNNVVSNNSIEIRLRELLVGKDPLFNREEKQKVIKALDIIKILDPACGSGAFLIALLNRMVYILQRLDPKNEEWKALQKEKCYDKTKMVHIDELHNEVRGQLKEIQDVFHYNSPDYGRKYYLIRNCIYGVDIQPIAIEVCKFRFFMSLIPEQKLYTNDPIQDLKDFQESVLSGLPFLKHANFLKRNENYSIKPFPNLETNFVVANTLVSLTDPSPNGILMHDINLKRVELRQNLRLYFSTDNRKQKENLRKKEVKIFEHFSHLFQKDGYNYRDLEKFHSFNRYDNTVKTDWFDPKWMFAIKQGFDIVIGRPPSMSGEKLPGNLKNHLLKSYETYEEEANLYIAFLEKSLSLVKDDAIYSLLIPAGFVSEPYGTTLRKLLLENYFVKEIMDVSEYSIFENASINNIILTVKKSPNKEITIIKKVKANDSFLKNDFQISILNQNMFLDIKDYCFDQTQER